MNEKDLAFVEIMNCFTFANQIWGAKQKDRFDEAKKAYELGMKIYREKFLQENSCKDNNLEL